MKIYFIYMFSKNRFVVLRHNHLQNRFLMRLLIIIRDYLQCTKVIII